MERTCELWRGHASTGPCSTAPVPKVGQWTLGPVKLEKIPTEFQPRWRPWLCDQRQTECLDTLHRREAYGISRSGAWILIPVIMNGYEWMGLFICQC